jgi:hypothetical protein
MRVFTFNNEPAFTLDELKEAVDIMLIRWYGRDPEFYKQVAAVIGPLWEEYYAGQADAEPVPEEPRTYFRGQNEE